MAEFKGQVNGYSCETCGFAIVTKNADDGVTPMLIGCRRPGRNCSGQMRSFFYRINQGLVADWEWYKPTSRHGLSRSDYDHVRSGGLLLRHLEKGTDDRRTLHDEIDLAGWTIEEKSWVMTNDSGELKKGQRAYSCTIYPEDGRMFTVTTHSRSVALMTCFYKTKGTF